MYFIFDGVEAGIYREKRGKEVGKVNTGEGIVEIRYVTNNAVMLNKSKKEMPPQLYPLLKSNLQKQVRRGEKEAVVTASMMMDINDFEFLRRLSIIAGEDVELSVETSTIVWYMAAVSKGFVLCVKDKEFILQYVSNLCEHKVCRRLELSVKKLNNELSMKEILESRHEDKEKLAGILFRIYFGGLSGDLPMMSALCDDFLQGRRLDCLENKGRIISVLKFTDSAVDFHIYPNLISLIAQDTSIEEEIIRKTIWECSSRINCRFVEKSNLNAVWTRISPSFTFHTKTYLSKIIKKYF